MTYKCEPETTYLTAGTFDEDSIRGQLPKVTEHIFLEDVGAEVRNCLYMKELTG